MEKNAPSLFKTWRILLVYVLAIGVTGFILWRNFTKTEFVKDTKGTHCWLDNNHNGKIEYHKDKFVPCVNGEYREQKASEVFQAIDWTYKSAFWICIAFLFMLGRDLGYVLRIRTLTRGSLSWKASIRTIFLWEFASALAPGVMSGATVAMFIMYRERIALGRATAIVVITAFFDNLYYVLLIPLWFLIFGSMALFPNASESSFTIPTLFWVAYGIFALLCLVLFLSIFIYPNFIKNILLFVCKIPFLARFSKGALKTGEEIEITSAELKSEGKSFWLKVGASTFLSWSSRFLVINAIVQAFFSLGLWQHFQLFGKQFILWMFLRISPTPGGSGVAEWAFSELLVNLTPSVILLTTLAVVWRLISYFPYLIIGGLILPTWLKKKQ